MTAHLQERLENARKAKLDRLEKAYENANHFKTTNSKSNGELQGWWKNMKSKFYAGHMGATPQQADKNENNVRRGRLRARREREEESSLSEAGTE